MSEEEKKNGRCLLLTPMSGDFPRVRKEIASVLREVGLIPILFEEFAASSDSIVDLVHTSIERADLIIADLTGNNANVMYEIGLAHARKKPVLMIAQKGGEEIPFDIRGFLYLPYDPNDLDEFKVRLRFWLRRYGYE